MKGQALWFDGRTSSYCELYTRVCRLANGLRTVAQRIRPSAGRTGYKCPRRIIVASELPRNTVGKIRKRQLRDMVEKESVTS